MAAPASPQPPDPPRRRSRSARAGSPRALGAALAALLAFTAGFADGQSYLSWHLFGANMTGNTVLLGIAATHEDLSRAVAVLAPIIAFISGCAIAQVLLRTSLAVSFAFEAALLIAAVFTSSYAWQLEVIALAMGVQNTTVKTFGPVKANTSFITGNYERVGNSLAHVMLGTAGRQDRDTLVVVIPLVVSYALGAAVASVLVQRHVPGVLLWIVPLILVAAILARPNAAEASLSR